MIAAAGSGDWGTAAQSMGDFTRRRNGTTDGWQGGRLLQPDVPQ